MLAAIERDHLAGHRRRRQDEAHRGGDLLAAWCRAAAASLRYCRRNCSSLCRGLGRVGPGPMALTRMRGASASAMVCVKVHSAALLSV